MPIAVNQEKDTGIVPESGEPDVPEMPALQDEQPLTEIPTTADDQTLAVPPASEAAPDDPVACEAPASISADEVPALEVVIVDVEPEADQKELAVAATQPVPETPAKAPRKKPVKRKAEAIQPDIFQQIEGNVSSKSEMESTAPEATGDDGLKVADVTPAVPDQAIDAMPTPTIPALDFPDDAFHASLRREVVHENAMFTLRLFRIGLKTARSREVLGIDDGNLDFPATGYEVRLGESADGQHVGWIIAQNEKSWIVTGFDGIEASKHANLVGAIIRIEVTNLADH